MTARTIDPPRTTTRYTFARLAGTRWPAKIGFVAAVLALWELAVRLGQPGSLPAPSRVAPTLVDMIGDGRLVGPVLQTLAAWALGLLVATAIGVAAGLVLGVSPVMERLTRFTVDFLRTIPSLALVPLAVLLYGSGIGSTLLLVVFASTWPILLQTAHGVHAVDPVASETCRSYRVRWHHRLLFLVVPGAAAYLATGVRIAASVSLLLSLSAELLIPAPGIGQEIAVTELGGDLPAMYAWIFVAGVLGVVINALFSRIERALLRWHPAHRREAR
ncbi:ABC-type nitrate/sulfonate/bicarbonate transport system permease component [Amycolatopsis bartoniae]|uniref:Putative sulfonate ABC transporter, permease n=1 Tax=Amycolatopsis bartoniae TaxID=941986 RepID=A0A8H9ITD6_9PSEU|nr:ABC transporter permease subunit [Amycolatopsis bartoniae]MBB2939895.1 ABC-type nitrate/sulfonate/bicarbonate transport system permease component [Amycolatopsis bartoniae]TVT08318.1 ABC transporter permease subunit [Amycolatopsis bartoniae]GHF35813.1 putative sulfonate ABC transporter, permease [Amycolatopsis bartoniae]